MKTKIGLFLCAVALIVPIQAAEPARESGKVLVLDNKRILEGDIQRFGDKYRVRRSVGETWVPADKAVCLCDSLEQVYIHFRSQANLHDADEHLRLARWCMANKLRAQALAEVTAALEIRPRHAESQRLLGVLRQPLVERPPSSEPEPVALDEEPSALIIPPDVNAKSVSTFTVKVQPILMNACASCHANGKGGAFKLTRALEAGNSRRSAQQNLAAVLGQVNLQQPQASTLLLKAASQHGDLAKAPLQDRHGKAFQTLEEWVQNAVAANPQLRGSAGTPITPLFTSESKPTESTATKVESSPSAEPVKPDASKPPVKESTQFSSNEQKPKPAAPVDEFDPAIFNRQMHPEKKP